MVGGKFRVRGDLGPPEMRRKTGAYGTGKRETADGNNMPLTDTLGNGLPPNTVVRSFAKPTNLSIAAGLLVNSQLETVILAREMYDNDPIAGAVADTVVGIPFGNFSLSGMPDKEHLKPYMTSLDRVRVKTLLPSLTLSYLVDGAFLGSGVFDDKDKCFSAMMPHDVVHAEITPAPFFGATPIVNLSMSPEAARQVHVKMSDPRLRAYLKFLPPEFLRGGTIELQPENTFYVPRRGPSHVPLGISLFRKIMIPYLLEKSLARGTIEMAYRRMRPIVHIAAGDENWDPSYEEMQELAGLFMDADLDPLGAVVTTRAGVQVQEISGAGDFWKWTDNVDVLTSVKLKGLGMPDGLLGGDMSLDSVSATLTIFVNMIRSLRDYITRTVFYEKMFPYIAITNNHRKDVIGGFEERSAEGSMVYNNHYVERATDSDVDISDYMMPTMAFHSSMRPEGDQEYMNMLMTLQQAGVPIPIRMMAAAGGQDIYDILNGAEDDIEVRQRIAAYNQAVAQLGGGGEEGGDESAEYSRFDPHAKLLPIKRRGIINREYDDHLHPRNKINGHTYVTTARYRKQQDEKANRKIAKAASTLAHRLNALAQEGRGPLRQRVERTPRHYSGPYSLG